MGVDRDNAQRAQRPRRGRPTRAPEEARSHRVVTFVTERELTALEQIAQEEDRSLSAVVHRIITQHLDTSRQTRAGEEPEASGG